MRADTYFKVPFEWRDSKAPIEDPLESDLAWLTGSDVHEPIDLVARVLQTSPGPEDRRAVEVLGADEAARRVLSLAHGFRYLNDRWHVLKTGDTLVGFVLPVVYDGCARDGLDEATIYHMGVAPEFRGSGFGRLLLRRAVRALVHHGVWRIYSDTPASNAPMIHLFETENWVRLPAHERPIALG